MSADPLSADPLSVERGFRGEGVRGHVGLFGECPINYLTEKLFINYVAPL